MRRVAIEGVGAGDRVLVVHGGPAVPDLRFDTAAVDGLTRSAQSSASIDRVVRLAREFAPDAVVIHSLAAPALTMALRPGFVGHFVHDFLCGVAKLFRRSGHQCGHALGARCLFDWYAGPCGHAVNPAAAVGALTMGRDHVMALRRADAVFVPSHFMRRYVIGEGVSSDTVEVVNNAVGLVDRGTQRGSAGQRTGLVLYAGRLSRDKGVQDALAALARLPDHVRLTVAGDGWFRPELEAIADRLGVSERVTFVGHLNADALARAYLDADVLVVPSLWPEPAGLVVPEAHQHHLPAVVYDSGGLGEWPSLIDGVTVVPRGDVPALAAGIAAVLSGGTSGATVAPTPRQGLLQHLRVRVLPVESG